MRHSSNTRELDVNQKLTEGQDKIFSILHVWTTGKGGQSEALPHEKHTHASLDKTNHVAKSVMVLRKRFGHNSKRYAWSKRKKKKKTANHQKDTIPMMKHAGGSIMPWGLFHFNQVGPNTILFWHKARTLLLDS